MANLSNNPSDQLFVRIKQLVDDGRTHIAQTVNTTLTLTYWNIGKAINEHLLHNKRAAYGEEVIQNLSNQLTHEYGRGWGVKHLQHCLRIAETFPESEIFYAVSKQLSWTHLRTIMYLDSDLKRDFYLEMCRLEKWSTRLPQEKIDSMLFERTAISLESLKPPTKVKWSFISDGSRNMKWNQKKNNP